MPVNRGGAADSRRPSTRTRLIWAGFTEVKRALSLLADPALAPFLPSASADGQVVGRGETKDLDPVLARLVEELGATADPDLALLALVRLAEACTVIGEASGDLSDTGAPARRLRALLCLDPDEDESRAVHRSRLLAVLGASQALGDFLITHPEHVEALAPDRAFDAPGRPDAAATLQGAVDAVLAGVPTPIPADVADRAVAALRVAYRDRLLAVVADDLAAENPVAHMPVVGERMTELADASLEAALAIARAVVGPPAAEVNLAVIAMGKTGARELNYISDVDVVYVVAPARRGADGETSEETAIRVGTRMATEIARVTSASGTEPPLWPLDTALRPEGKDGALVRTLASHLAYYQRWASSWEFQALLKARACAGDRELGAAYEAGVAPLVWSASQRENFVDDARAMRRRVEQESGSTGRDDRRIKLGPGGLRDVEFTVQLLQLVHGRADARLRARSTLEALDALSAGGYVGRADAAELGDCYRMLRLLEHRAQLLHLRRTHDLPDTAADLRCIGRGIDRRTLKDPESVRALFTSVRRRVRALHEEIYYRPLLSVAASLSTEELTLTPDAARERLAAFGYLDPDGALHHIQALTEGVSRRAAIQRQLLPVIIGWIGQGPDPDNGLLSFRRLSESIGGSHWYLAMLRDSPVAARRLCQVLSGARWTTDRLAERPESIAWLDDDAELVARPRGAICSETQRILRRRALTATDAVGLEAQATEAVRAAMGVRTRELIRAALADSLSDVDPARTAQILGDATDAALGAALTVATGLVIALREGPAAVAAGPDADGNWPGAAAHHAIIAMGRLGGREITYTSDADVLFVHEPRPGADPDVAATEAEAVAKWVTRLLAQAHPHPLVVDTGLRPEGRQGPVSRSLGSYAEYYGRWASVWERQALLRARPCAGDRRLGERFKALINPLRWSPNGLDDAGLREIRRLKARMESERLPRGADPSRHVKLGPGGLTDVEWSAQLLQLTQAVRVPGLRTTSTLDALAAAAQAGLISVDDAGKLTAAWVLASRVRAASVLGTGRAGGTRVDVLPTDQREIRLVARLLGIPAGNERDLEDIYRRTARHARRVVEHVVFGDTAPSRAARATTTAADTGSAPVKRPAPGRVQGQGAAPRTPPRPTVRRSTGPYPWS
ncbi:bifunctional [glutamine synthetase] adenylyltransferase/[glutamine synthetase]-adenylyl-L-tyrosine phosphorylase [Actinomyces sp. MRS3W]|uniref:bifunctional [glutamine synthetase] adenylyltransferase/[glutamine synthetase]-adenylyl-L-tyrosine phosphorylase n=1 Tax=Actinomyces sp. MRS3W TaxID=2800796 RepID=UPI0028FD46E3|nr:bifunctional [glutamine synthetase] adenylyltransferase/[glutamine synthetase]-adenylyl-L-tyrosine phosphorylase [Actinomyces sp. MRS3W]MDU0348943.1 bifunctional [glutamine synthetase] adenylyltransferase/[glutamine synthetase]-adenylyl-L-tyrosine phosphorylase [Actinomyces sp. MRS3W]